MHQATKNSKRWYENTEVVKKIIDTAHKLVKKYSTERVFSLGQSPAWVVKAAELLAKKKGSSQMFGGIAFSGRFVHEGCRSSVGEIIKEVTGFNQ